MTRRQHTGASGGQLGAALVTAGGEDGASGPSAHAQAEAMGLGPATVVRLEGALAHEGLRCFETLDPVASGLDWCCSIQVDPATGPLAAIGSPRSAAPGKSCAERHGHAKTANGTGFGHDTGAATTRSNWRAHGVLPGVGWSRSTEDTPSLSVATEQSPASDLSNKNDTPGHRCNLPFLGGHRVEEALRSC